jgi:hypothetical protein
MKASQLTFVVIEDEPIQRQVVVQMLHTLGATHGWAALLIRSMLR